MKKILYDSFFLFKKMGDIEEKSFKMSNHDILEFTRKLNKLCYILIPILIIGSIGGSTISVFKSECRYEFAVEIFGILLIDFFLILTCSILVLFKNIWHVNFMTLLTASTIIGVVIGAISFAYIRYIIFIKSEDFI